MPFILIRYKNPALRGEPMMALTRYLPEIVASALHVAGDDTNKHLVSTDIEVEVREVGPYDVTHYDLEIIIWANDFPERRRDLEERKDSILKAVRSLLNGYDLSLSGYVWVLLAPSAFGET